MSNIPLNRELIAKVCKENGIQNISNASIREIKKLIGDVEKETGTQFIKMEMGIPGLPTPQIAIDAEIKALKNGVSALYPEIYGMNELKEQISLFVKNFINIDVPTNCCLPTVGSMQGGFASFLTISRRSAKKNKVLFIDPGFAVQKQQCQILGIPMETFDVYDFRGEKLKDKLESYLSKGDVSTILYSNPNNPSWICFTDEELKIIGELANKYGVIVIEDLAYFAMDFRKDYSKPGVPPYQPTVANYTKEYILLISSSKSFSYAGQRIGMMILSPDLFNSKSEELKKYYNTDQFGRAMVFGSLYVLSSGTAHSPQYGLAALLKATNDGTYNFRDDIIEYGERAKIMKKMFTDNGFYIVYDKDLDDPIADGFYFTAAYPGMDGDTLLSELVHYGISAIALKITGSTRTEGIRCCVSLVLRNELPELQKRLEQFGKDHKR